MKLIEAMKTLHTIEKRIVKNCDLIAQYAAHVSCESPTFETQERQAKEVDSLVQANLDLIAESAKLKSAVERTNLSTKVVIRNKDYTISELIQYRRKLGAHVRSTFASLNTSAAHARISQIYRNGVDVNNPPRVVMNYKEDKKNEYIKNWEEILTSIDGKLEVVNAETELLTS